VIFASCVFSEIRQSVKYGFDVHFCQLLGRLRVFRYTRWLYKWRSQKLKFEVIFVDALFEENVWTWGLEVLHSMEVLSKWFPYTNKVKVISWTYYVQTMRPMDLEHRWPISATRAGVGYIERYKRRSEEGYSIHCLQLLERESLGTFLYVAANGKAAHLRGYTCS